MSTAPYAALIRELLGLGGEPITIATSADGGITELRVCNVPVARELWEKVADRVSTALVGRAGELAEDLEPVVCGERSL